MSVEMLGNLRFGSDHKEDLEGLSPSTAVFLWNYEKQKMHGIFAGTSRPVEDTSKHADYLYEVRTHLCCHLFSVADKARQGRHHVAGGKLCGMLFLSGLGTIQGGLQCPDGPNYPDLCPGTRQVFFCSCGSRTMPIIPRCLRRWHCGWCHAMAKLGGGRLCSSHTSMQIMWTDFALHLLSRAAVRRWDRHRGMTVSLGHDHLY